MDDDHRWIAITANYRPDGGLPTDAHHIESRGAHPREKLNPDNLLGLTHAEHMARHDRGFAYKRPTRLSDIW